MSAGAPGAIGPVSVRYAAQIRELLYAQAMQRMAAEQEAARATAAADERSARAEAARAKASEPLDVKVTAPEPAAKPEPAKAPEPKPEPQPTGQLVDIQA